MNDETILETEDLTKEFAGFTAVNGVSLRVKRGSIHALIGPNGAGKTTCFNLLTKFLSPNRNDIFTVIQTNRDPNDFSAILLPLINNPRLFRTHNKPPILCHPDRLRRIFFTDHDSKMIYV